MSFLHKLFKREDYVNIKVEHYEHMLIVKYIINNAIKAKIQCVLEDEGAIMIGDIIHKSSIDFNKGIGTQMMKKLLEFAKEHNYKYIYGNLSECDYNHKDRAHHFYKKFGFNIIEYPEIQDCYYGKIELNLT